LAGWCSNFPTRVTATGHHDNALMPVIQPAPVSIDPDLQTRPHPTSLQELFWAFTWLALQGFGGVLAVVQREMVDNKHWLTREQFLEDWAVAQVLPGPSVINLSLMIGDRYFGWRGGLTALAGMLTFPMVIVLGLAMALAGTSDLPQVQGALRGMSAVAAGMIVATGLKLLPSLKENVLGAPMCIALSAMTFVAVALWRIRLVWALLGLGGLGAVWAYRQLGAANARASKTQGTP